MLVSAFYDREKILAAYKTAVEENYRFFSFGDAMLILGRREQIVNTQEITENLEKAIEQ